MVRMPPRTAAGTTATSIRALFAASIFLLLFANSRTSSLSRHLSRINFDESLLEYYLMGPSQLESSGLRHTARKALPYQPAPVEEYVQQHSKELKLDTPVPGKVTTCHLWKDSAATPFYFEMHAFLAELEDYYSRIDKFQLEEGITDLRHHLDGSEDICEKLQLHEQGLQGIFAKSKQLSHTQAGWVEPLLPPMRHPKFCLDESYLLNLQYMVHDFQAMCQSLKPTSRTVFVDMGASLSFHLNQQSPVLFLLDMFQKFGIQFDHIYAYELSQQNPNHVFAKIPNHLQAAYHWINVGVATDPESPLNPWKLILDNYNEDDLIIVKLDVDTPVLERQLAQQLLDHPRLATIIDHFYFEHHVNQQELARHWGPTKESVKESLDLFRGLREKGVAAHFWV